MLTQWRAIAATQAAFRSLARRSPGASALPPDGSIVPTNGAAKGLPPSAQSASTASTRTMETSKVMLRPASG